MVQRHRPPAQFPFDQREFQVAQTRAANAFGEIAGVEAKVYRLALDLGGDFGGDLAGTFDKVFVRIDLVLDKAPHRGGDHFLFFGQPVLHRVLPRGQLA